MHLHIKKTSRIINSRSKVDKVFKAQGFRKIVKKDISYYHLYLTDNITRTNYELQIPFQELYLNNKEPSHKIEEIIVYTKSPLMKNKEIPHSIISAANEKAEEALSYLTNNVRRH